jgi:hypothetical protein
MVAVPRQLVLQAMTTRLARRAVDSASLRVLLPALVACGIATLLAAGGALPAA